MFSISLDDYDEGILKQRGYRKIRTVKSRIKQLAMEGHYVNVGVVIDSLNVDRIKEIIWYILQLGVADIKLSVSTKDEIPLEKLQGLKNYFSGYPILSYRVNRFRKGQTMRGLLPEDTFKCALVKHDISIVGDKHYPCLVYAREHGAPIGLLSGDVEADRMTWYNSHVPQNDPICRRYCMDFKCEFNRAAAQ
jgi:hypothetical protein